jgi:hypothetical protein
VPIIKKVSYFGLKDLAYTIIDTDAQSRDFFRVVYFPEEFRSGKNLFKIKGHPVNFVEGSEIYVEILDYNGDPIYYEPIQYLEQGGTRVVSVYIYPNTSPGEAIVYLAGRARFNPNTGEEIPFSRDVNSPEYFNIPNVLWRKPIVIRPQAPNNSEIIFTQPVQVTVFENVQQFYELSNINNLQTTMTASINSSLSMAPGAPFTTAPTIFGFTG